MLSTGDDFNVFLVDYQGKFSLLTDDDILFENIYTKNIADDKFNLIKPNILATNSDLQAKLIIFIVPKEKKLS